MFTNKLGSCSWWTSSCPILKSIGEGTAWCCLVLWIRQKEGSHHTQPGLYHHTPRASLLHSHLASFTLVVSLFWWGECKGHPPFRNTQSKSKQFKKKCVWCANAFKLQSPVQFLQGFYLVIDLRVPVPLPSCCIYPPPRGSVWRIAQFRGTFTAAQQFHLETSTFKCSRNSIQNRGSGAQGQPSTEVS